MRRRAVLAGELFTLRVLIGFHRSQSLLQLQPVLCGFKFDAGILARIRDHRTGLKLAGWWSVAADVAARARPDQKAFLKHGQNAIDLVKLIELARELLEET